MKIYTNIKNEIKAINYTDDETLNEIDISESCPLNNMDEFHILNYCYKEVDGGYEMYPRIDINILELFNFQKNKIDILNEQNANLLLDNAKKEIEIINLNKNLANITLEVAKMKVGV